MEQSPGRWGVVVIAMISIISPAAAGDADLAPVVPGYQALRNSGKVPVSAQGELLLAELNCTSCHAAPSARLSAKGAPDLSDVGARVTPSYLRQFLLNPHAVKPGTTMPDLFHASADEARRGAVDYLVHFLVSQGGPITDPIGAGTEAIVESGRTLYHSIGCAACHAPEKSAAIAAGTKAPSVALGNLAEKTTLAALTEFLVNPYRARPSGRMPAMGLNSVEAKAIATYLLHDQLAAAAPTTRPMPGTGLRCEYFEEDFKSARPEEFDAAKARTVGRVKRFTLDVPGHRGNRPHFGIRFTGSIWIPHDGQYRFGLKSDDGSILWIDGREVANFDGIHPPEPEHHGEPVELKAGMHAVTLNYFQSGGGVALEVYWEGPSIPHEQVPTDVLAIDAGQAMAPLHTEPFTLDPEKAAMGGQMFSILGCASCHVLPGHASMKRAKPLVELDVANPEGCLGDQITKGRPRYDLSPDQREAIVAALKDRASLAAPPDPAGRAIHEMAAMNCFACHERGGVGGVTRERNDLFKSAPNVDLGDEGRIPPRLTGVGSKLLPEVLVRILFKGELRVRPYYQTRMPSFKQETLADLPEGLAKADAAGDNGVSPAQVISGNERFGRQLVGVRGLGCVNCHGVKGAKSLGVPGPDLVTVRDRLRPQYFARWLADPGKLVHGTRMPSFWTEGESSLKDILGGRFDRQCDAIWSYLQQGPDMPLPEGIRIDGIDELVPSDEVIVLRAFVTGVGPRAILVGNPDGLHWVFDANTVRLAKAWHGKFFDAEGSWEQRGGAARAPLGKDVLEMPPGPSFAVLESQGAAWPHSGGLYDRNTGGQFKGYTLDKAGRPTFHYVLRGVDIQESAEPKGVGRKATLVRHFTLAGKSAPKDLFFLIAAGKKIEPRGTGEWRIDEALSVHLTADRGAGASSTETRDGKDGLKLLVLPVTFERDAAAFTVEISW